MRSRRPDHGWHPNEERDPPIMRTLWKGSISFGLVSIPVSLYPATRREELRFRMLRKKDLSPINYKRVAEVDGKEVPWDQIVKGYEYEKDKYVVLKDEDFKRVDVEATQTVDIINFVKIEDVDPLLFYKPYYLEVGKGGDKAYVLLRDSLVKTKKIAIAKVVIRARQHLAAVKPQKDGLMLELMHFPGELIDVEEFKEPAERKVAAPEMRMAGQLIDSMSVPWRPEEYTDDYHEALEKLIEEKIEHGDEEAAKPKRRKQPSNVIDLAEVLKQSIAETKGAKKSPAKRKKPAARGKARRRAA